MSVLERVDCTGFLVSLNDLQRALRRARQPISGSFLFNSFRRETNLHTDQTTEEFDGAGVPDFAMDKKRQFTWEELSSLNNEHNAHVAVRGKVRLSLDVYAPFLISRNLCTAIVICEYFFKLFIFHC